MPTIHRSEGLDALFAPQGMGILRKKKVNGEDSPRVSLEMHENA